MKKNIWIFNHYATNSYFNKGGRHYWFAENLIKNEYKPVIFCADTRHNSDDIIKVKENFDVRYSKGIPFVFVKTSHYQANGLDRIKNMISFYKNLFSTTKEYADKYGKPDIILASSVHPLTLVAGIKIAKKFGVPCICEVRDLWPESLVAYGSLKRNSPLTRLLYKGEKWIYKNADSVIMTWEGGKEYIKDQGWEKDVDLSKFKHISNGVVIESFDENSVANQFADNDLNDKNFKNIVYAGSVRKVNNIGLLLDAAKSIQLKGYNEIRLLIYGSGTERELLIKRCKDEEINNVVFKGHVEKKYIPYILKKAYVNILHNSSTSLDKYGQSQNKFFEYLASGKCIVQTYATGYSVIERENCGINVHVQNAEEIAETIIKVCKDEKTTNLMGHNARLVAPSFDFGNLTRKLIYVIEETSLLKK
ncbi:glycosyltransferase family 4 protein [Planococcus sp. SIMBA_160]